MIGEFIEQMTRQMSNHLWQSTWFAVAAALLVLVFRKNRAQVRYWLWLSASLKFLIPFSLLMSLGNGLWSVLAARNFANEIAAPAVSLTLAQITQPFPDTLPIAPSAMHTANWIVIAIFALWACGFVAIAIMRLRGWLRIQAAVRVSKPLDIPAAFAIRSSPGLLEPGVVGFLHPMLLLPEGILKSLTAPQLEAVLAHELCHIRRRDNLTSAIHMVVETAFWFHPAVWWIGARLVEERERACDEAVLSLGSEPRDYADAILNVCKLYVESPLVCVSGISGSDLKKRVVRIMTHRLTEKLTLTRKALLMTAAVAAIAGPLAFGIMYAPLLRAQSSTVDWEKAAGGRMAFDVASVKQNTAAIGPQTLHSNIPLGPQEASISTGGLLSSTDWPLSQYMAFAYKLTPSQVRAVQSQSPKWTNANRYDIQARAPGNPNEDQFRLMMQALLADRFKLAIHHETRQLPIMALVLDKPGKLGPQLQRHPEVPSCSDAPLAPSSGPVKVPTIAGGFPMICGMLANLPPTAPGRARLGARSVPMSMITTLFNVSQVSGVDRPIVDKTGLTGKVDFVIEFSLDYSDAKGPLDLMYIPIPTGTPPPPDPSAPTFLEALKEQLGLKLESQTGPVDVLVIDHIEEPSPN